MSEKSILTLQNITKKYWGVTALDSITFSLREGEVHALVGENGAGKSTLIKTLAGAVVPDSGQIIIDGQTYQSMTPARAMEHGIAVIYQEFNLMPTLTVAENIFAGQKLPGETVFFDYKQRVKRSEEIFERMGVKIDPNAVVGDLSVAYMQCVEIAKAISKNARILVMDEPTAPLTDEEVKMLFQIIKKLHEQNIAIIYISHRLNEIFDISERVTVMRDGKIIEQMNTCDTSRNLLVKAMVGREINDVYPARSNAIGEEVLRVENLCGNGDHNISFALHKGEILGIEGLVGAGRTELVRLLFGADPIQSGTIYLEGKPFNPRSPRNAINHGIGFLPEDRKRQGLFLELSLRWNISFPILKTLCKAGVIRTKAEKALAQKMMKELNVKAASMEQFGKELSGGNQQKLIIAKWMAANCKILIFDEPTRGIDVGAKYEIYKLLNSLCEQGIGILVISSDMEEMLGVTDRMTILCEGEQIETIDKKQYDQELIMQYASGTK